MLNDDGVRVPIAGQPYPIGDERGLAGTAVARQNEAVAGGDRRDERVDCGGVCRA